MHPGDPSSLYIRARNWENCFSSRAAETEKASPPPSRRHEILEFMQQRVKGGQALGHYDGCKAVDCHMCVYAPYRCVYIYIYMYMSAIHVSQAGIFKAPGVDLHTQIPHSGPDKGFVRRQVMKHPKDGRKKVVAYAGTPLARSQCTIVAW